MHELSIIDTVV